MNRYGEQCVFRNYARNLELRRSLRQKQLHQSGALWKVRGQTRPAGHQRQITEPATNKRNPLRIPAAFSRKRFADKE